ncbi:Uncharacterised protein [Serratia odorifera]|uniref:Uncharacterized protein n=1 Tax=Serratia odorifera TaxID=618 RepID=A0A447KN24_SEROD|nr:Uncharacterised protein [Serratia odorifera]
MRGLFIAVTLLLLPGLAQADAIAARFSVSR